MSNRLSSGLFFITALSVLMATSVSMYFADKSKKLLNTEYKNTLSRLFKVVKVCKADNRHGFTSENLFGIRKAHFKSVFANSWLHNKVKVIHVTGTKGKGSTVEYIAAGIRSSGAKVGVFSSPHLHTARERLKLGKALITKEDFIRHGHDSLAALSHQPWAVFFDMLLQMAITYFAEQRAEYLLLEAGIGGRFDSTNFLDEVSVAVITSISLDHQALLGNTVEEIAYQKAGIIKKNCHAFTPANQRESVLQVLRKQAREVNAILHEVPILTNREWMDSMSLNLSYNVQVENACLAASVLEHLEVSTQGMKNYYWPCRMETFSLREAEIIIDGCHNGNSVEQFLAGVRSKYPAAPLLVVFGAGVEKSVEDMVQAVFTLGDDVLFVQSKHFKSLTEAELIGLTKHEPDWRRKLYPVKGEKICARVEVGTVGNRIISLLNQLRSGQSLPLHHQLRDRNLNNQNNLVNLEVTEDSLSSSTISSNGYTTTDSDSNNDQNNSGNGNNGNRPYRSLAPLSIESNTHKPIIAVCGSLFVAAEAREALYRDNPELFVPDDWVTECDE